MRFKSRLRKLEVILAPPPPACDCPWPLNQFELPDGSHYPPLPPCLRGRCPVITLPGEPPQVRAIVLGHAIYSDGRKSDYAYDVGPNAFRRWDPDNGSPASARDRLTPPTTTTAKTTPSAIRPIINPLPPPDSFLRRFLVRGPRS